MGNNATGGKRKNKTRVFRFISQQGRTSKLEIVSRLGISLPTVLQTLKELTEDGLIWEMGEFESTGGRKAKALAAVRGSRFAMGLDITRNHISWWRQIFPGGFRGISGFLRHSPGARPTGSF